MDCRHSTLASETEVPARKLSSTSTIVTDAFVDRCDKIRVQLKHHQRWTIDPRHHKWIHLWDVPLLLAMAYSMLFTPVEIGLLYEFDITQTHFFIMFIANQTVEAIFLLDLLRNFFVAYQEPASKGGHWVTNSSAIRCHYLKSWFAVDFISILPVDLLEQMGILKPGPVTSVLRLNRTVRMVRFVKMLRVLKGSRIAAQWQDALGLTYAQVCSSCAFPDPSDPLSTVNTPSSAVNTICSSTWSGVDAQVLHGNVLYDAPHGMRVGLHWAQLARDPRSDPRVGAIMGTRRPPHHASVSSAPRELPAPHTPQPSPRLYHSPAHASMISGLLPRPLRSWSLTA